jgi:hypothetical protein
MRARLDGGQGQDGWRATMLRPHQGRPSLGQPGAPLTAVCSAAPFPSRLSGIRYSPCTCSPMEAARRQTLEKVPAGSWIRDGIDNPPSCTWYARPDMRQTYVPTLYLPTGACQAARPWLRACLPPLHPPSEVGFRPLPAWRGVGWGADGRLTEAPSPPPSPAGRGRKARGSGSCLKNTYLRPLPAETALSRYGPGQGASLPGAGAPPGESPVASPC